MIKAAEGLLRITVAAGFTAGALGAVPPSAVRPDGTKLDRTRLAAGDREPA
jgi:hypothetical protein